MTRHIPLLLCLLSFLHGPVTAENVDLVTLPGRDRVQLTIYNSEDITLVRESRALALKHGENRLQFSWAGTLIDPTSVELRVLEHTDDVEVLDTLYLGQKPQALIWNIASTFEGQVAVEVSYFTSGISWSMDYVAITDAAERAMDFTGHVRVLNGSGEDYANAELRLIVGNINLVEKIAELAQRRGMPQPPSPAEEDYPGLRRDAARGELAALAPSGAAGPGAPPEIVKEGLSEYFMFSVEGRQTVPNGWSQRMQAVESAGMKFAILYRMRAHQYGARPVRFFLWPNDEEHGLGKSPLPNGLVRVFRQNGNEGLSYLGVQSLNYVPIRAEIEANLGPDDLVVYETRQAGTDRHEFQFSTSNGQEYVSGWDEHTRWVDSIRNYRTEAIRFELRRVWGGDVTYTSDAAGGLFDFQTVETTLELPARSKRDMEAAVVTRQGSGSRQSRVELKR